MKIQLNQIEIEEALRIYVKHQGINLDNCNVDIAFTAGRGNNGMTADLDITPAKPKAVNTAFQPQVVQSAPVQEVAESSEQAEPAQEPEVIEEDDAVGDEKVSLFG